ncbi:MAG: DUF2284 domain-containing protein [Candidatus Jettenia sp. CY-1]|nr:DUF2284 domain-containing protein [Candidatus Jettenia sp.]WKZ20018.1 MAG: DUF2284 domain-containing protein [Candidatus Jettenia sp. CY-1]
MHIQNSVTSAVQSADTPYQDSADLWNVLMKKSLELGCEQAIIIPTKTIVIGRWVQLKCKYGCDEYGKKLTCPPHSPSYDDMKDILKEYNKALLLHGHISWQMRYIITEVEKATFSMGFYKAFGLGAGPCKLCESCATSSACTHTAEARPSMEACGIDVYQTVRNHDLKIETLKNKADEVNIYGLVLLE